MTSTDHVRLMARYNAWQNRSLYDAASTLGEEYRTRATGAFFGTIHGTLNHLIWADRVWLARFLDEPRPAGGGIKESPSLYSDWAETCRERKALDARIIAWVEALDSSWLDGDLVWTSGMSGRVASKSRWLCVTHFFNHQTHHRGQVHAMLTAAGAKPDDTDLILMTS